MSGIPVGRVGHGPLTDFARAFRRRQPQSSPSPIARYIRNGDAFLTLWARHGGAQLAEPADVVAALRLVLGGTERFPRELFVAARRFQSSRPASGT